jgi:hypothetical protein
MVIEADAGGMTTEAEHSCNSLLSSVAARHTAAEGQFGKMVSDMEVRGNNCTR